MEYWSTNGLEYWTDEVLVSEKPSAPELHDSNSPVPHSSSELLQMLFEVERLPPALQPKAFRDRPGSIVTRRACDVAARMTR
jgi:hypothetical protein